VTRVEWRVRVRQSAFRSDDVRWYAPFGWVADAAIRVVPMGPSSGCLRRRSCERVRVRKTSRCEKGRVGVRVRVSGRGSLRKGLAGDLAWCERKSSSDMAAREKRGAVVQGRSGRKQQE
jgi:hypothetical protein